MARFLEKMDFPHPKMDFPTKEWISKDKMDIFAEAPCMNEEHEVFCSV